MSCRKLIQYANDPTRLDTYMGKNSCCLMFRNVSSQIFLTYFDSFVGEMAPRMSRKAMLKLLENADRQTEGIGTTSVDTRKKNQTVINMGDGSGKTESGLILKKRGSTENDDEGVVASKRRVDVAMEASSDHTGSSEDLFHQLLGSRVPQPPDSQSVWSSSFLLWPSSRRIIPV